MATNTVDSTIITSGGSSTLSIPDYTAELNDVKAKLDTLNGNLSSINTNLQNLNLNLHGNSPAAAGTGVLQNLFGPTAASIPNTVPAILNAQHGQLQAQTNFMRVMANNLLAIAGAVVDKSADFAQLASQFSIFNASAQIFIAQMARKQAFEVAATNAALTRSGLPEVEPTQASVNETMSTAVTDAVTVSTQAKVGGFVNEQITNATTFAGDVATNYIGSIGLVQTVSAKLTSLRNTLTGQEAEAQAAAGEEVTADTNSSTRVA